MVCENVCMITNLPTKRSSAISQWKTFISVLPTRWRRKPASIEIATLSAYVFRLECLHWSSRTGVQFSSVRPLWTRAVSVRQISCSNKPVTSEQSHHCCVKTLLLAQGRIFIYQEAPPIGLASNHMLYTHWLLSSFYSQMKGRNRNWSYGFPSVQWSVELPSVNCLLDTPAVPVDERANSVPTYRTAIN